MGIEYNKLVSSVIHVIVHNSFDNLTTIFFPSFSIREIVQTNQKKPYIFTLYDRDAFLP